MPSGDTPLSEMGSVEKGGMPDTAAQPPAVHKDPAPDGGLRAWLVVLGVWCSLFVSFGWLNSIGTFQEYYQHELLSGYSPGTVSWIPSLTVFFIMGMGPIIGQLYDRFGPRYLMLGGTFLHVFGLMMASISKQYYQLLLSQGICSDLGASAVFQCSLNALHGWFSKRRGAAFGIAGTGSSVGGVVFPIMTSRLIRRAGFGWAMRTCAFLILALLVVANLTVAARHPPRPRDGPSGHGAALAKPFREFNFVLVVLGLFLFTFGMITPVNYIAAQAVSAGVDATVVEYLVAILNAGSLFGRLMSGFLGDKIGRYNIFVVVCYVTGILNLALWIPASTTGAFAAYAALFGFFSGAYVSLLAVLVVQISPLEEAGFRTGVAFFLAGVAGLVTGPICGSILGNTGGWTGIKIFAGVFCLAGTTSVLLARLRITGWQVAKVF
ncbi:hypothetical protein DL770_008218 [Monosporascus sp. CRB-9-2]|nr:hypothetical protein DL770_008218 [Monosporascus sp. CRB-9-2]